jgi:molybdopterin converting factor subunit 1
MIVTVHLFARAKDLAGADRLTLALPAGATVAELRTGLARQAPALADFLARCAVAVQGEYAQDETVIPEDADVAVIPPVSGGSGLLRGAWQEIRERRVQATRSGARRAERSASRRLNDSPSPPGSGRESV